jgi:predicted metal-dependent phosphoesterase TrpH
MKLDMHFHSHFSDGTSDVRTLLKLAQKKELDFVALTDHDRVSDEFSLLA